MADVVDAETRSRMMSGISGRNTRPEILVRKLLFSRGLRYRLHVKQLAGKPDIVLPRFHAVVFVHGCFWHQHDCHLFRMPATRTEFWKEKIGKNAERDLRHYKTLLGEGWRVAKVWECALKGRTKRLHESVADSLVDWLNGESIELDIRGHVEKIPA